MIQLATGAEFPVRSEIVEIVKPKLLVLRSDPQPELGLAYVTLTRVGLCTSTTA